jgi:hypothetical protein
VKRGFFRVGRLDDLHNFIEHLLSVIIRPNFS